MQLKSDVMMPTEQEERFAALLSALGSDLTDSILADLPADVRTRIRTSLERVNETPFSPEEIEEALEDFMRFFRFAMDQAKQTPSLKVFHPDDGEDVEETEVSTSTPPPAFQPTDDAVADLERLKPYQIVGALRSENPQTIALVLNCLSPQKAGAALQQLPSKIRSDVFLKLRKPPSAPNGLIERIVRTTVDKGCVLNVDAVSDPEEEGNRKMAELLRATGAAERMQMLQALEEDDPESAAIIKGMLYLFEDLLLVSDRSLQKILSEIDSGSLATALKDVDERIVDKVMANLSKRARATLAEEIEFLGNVKQAEQDAAQKAVCDTIARLDQSGDLEME